MADAFVSNRIVTLQGTRPGALLIEAETIRAICNPSEIPADATIHDHTHLAILPGLVDTHVHINEPGRTEWEGFRTATRAAAAGGYTTLIDMPLNCLPETTTVAALEAKRAAASALGPDGKPQCFVDWAPWGGAVADNQQHILPLARAGVLGYKCFLIYPGCDGFTMIDQQQLEAALPHIAESGLPLLVHAELAGPIEAAAPSLINKDWRRYETYLASRPDEAELQAIRLMIRLCRQYKFHLHIVHLSTAQALDDLQKARAEGLPVTVETCPHYLHFAAEQIPDASTLHKCAPPIRSKENQKQAPRHWPLRPSVGRYRQPLTRALHHSHRRSQPRHRSQRHRPLDEHRSRRLGPPLRQSRLSCTQPRSQLRHLRHRTTVHRYPRQTPLPPPHLALPQ
jgi:allantoinase